jgi:hypothetical protein
MQLSPFPCHLVPLRSKYFPQHPIISGAIPLLPLYLHDVNRRNFTSLPIALRSSLKLYQAGHFNGLTECRSVNLTLRAKSSRSGTERVCYKKEGLNTISRDRKCIVCGGVFREARAGDSYRKQRCIVVCVCVCVCVCAATPTNILRCLNSSPVNQCSCMLKREYIVWISSEVNWSDVF